MTTQTQENGARQFGLGALVTTAAVTAMLSIAGSALITKHIVDTRQVDHPLAVVNMVQMASEITRLAAKGRDAEEMLEGLGNGINRLREVGYVVLDARNILSAPERYYVRPSQIIRGASDKVAVGYEAPEIVPKEAKGKSPSDLLRGFN